jgi:hypothetical protein
MGVGPTHLPIAMAMAIVTAMLIDIATVVFLARGTDGFAPTIVSCPTLHQAQANFGSVVPPPFAFSLSALVYGADGSVVEDDAFENPEQQEESLLESLKVSVADPSIWNAIGCAFAPPPHHQLVPEVVRDAAPVRLSDKSIDIAVAIPASVERGLANAAANQLVRVLVTVGFPQAFCVSEDATTDEKLSAIRGQIELLKGLASDRLAQRRASSSPSPDDPGYYEKLVIEQRWQERLEEEPTASFDGLPGWWSAIEPPFSSMELVDEAKLLKRLLNEDEFEDELRALFVKHSDENNPLVIRAAVASIGTSGMFLKGRVAAATRASDDDDELEVVATASIPYSNPPREVKTMGDLREGVLLLVESVDPVPMPVVPQAKEVAFKDSEAEIITPFNEQVMEMVTAQENEATDALESEPEPEEPKSDESEADEAEPEEPETEEPDVPTDESEEEESEENVSETPSRQQPKPHDEEAKLAAKYAAIEDLGERAFAILRDLGMI